MSTGGSLADLEMGGGVVRALRMARSDAAEAAYAVNAVPIPLLRGLEPELEVLPEAVFGQGYAAFAVDDRILTEPGWDGDLVRVTGHCGDPWWCVQRRRARQRALASAGCRWRSTAAGWCRPLPVWPACGRRWRWRCAAASRAATSRWRRRLACGSPRRPRPREWWATLRSSGVLCGAWWTIRAGAWRGQGCCCSAAWIRSRIAWFRARV